MPLHSWIWPKGTFFQRRLQEVRERQIEEPPNGKPGAGGKETWPQTAVAPSTSTPPNLFVLHDVLTPAGVNSLPTRSLDNLSSDRKDKGTTAAPEDLVPIDLSRLGKKLSPTQALLALEREGWARLTNGTFRRVEFNEKSVQAALHKENLETFQSGLVHSGDWVRVNPSDPEPARAATPNIENGAEVDRSKINVAAPAPWQFPAPASPAVPSQAVVCDRSSQSVEENSGKPQSAQPSHDQWGQIAHEKSDPSKPQEIDWPEIDDKLLWLAKPSS